MVPIGTRLYSYLCVNKVTNKLIGIQTISRCVSFYSDVFKKFIHAISPSHFKLKCGPVQTFSVPT